MAQAKARIPTTSMKNTIHALPGKWPAVITFLCIFITQSASAKKIYPAKGSDNGIYLNGNTFAYAAGDTLVLKASQNPFTYFSIENFHGTASNPVVVIN